MTETGEIEESQKMEQVLNDITQPKYSTILLHCMYTYVYMIDYYIKKHRTLNELRNQSCR